MPDLVIELDLHEDREEQISSRRRWPEHSHRLWIVAGLAAACVLALGSAGRPVPAVHQVADIKLHNESELIALAGEILIDEPSTLTALDSRTAQTRWRVDTGLGRHLIRNEGDLVLVTGADTPVDGSASQLWSLAIHLGTGEVRWRLPGFVTVTGGLVVSHVADRSAPVPARHLTVYNLAGRPVWSKAPVADLHVVDVERQTVLLLDATLGELVEYRLDSGALVTRTVHPDLAGAHGLHYLDGEALAFFRDGRVKLRHGAEFIDGSGIPVGQAEQIDCGSLWCVYSPETYSITLVDKESGTVVHGDERWELIVHTDAGIVGIGPEYGEAIRIIDLFDPVTRRSQQLSGWTIVGPRIDARVVRWHGPLFLMSATPQRTFFAVAENGGIRVAGSVPHPRLAGCAATNYLIACRVDAETVRAWHPS